MLSLNNHTAAEKEYNNASKEAARPIRIAIADDHILFNRGIAALISDTPNLELCASFFNGQQLLDWYNGQNADIILIDLHMPVLNGIEASKLLLSCFAEVKIIVLSVDDTPNAIRAMRDMGVFAYLVKNTDPDNFITAIESVHAGQKVFPKITAGFNETFAVNFRNPVAGLTKKEIQILKLIAVGATTKKIAAQLFVTPGTVKRHRENMLNKTGATNIAQLIGIATFKGII